MNLLSPSSIKYQVTSNVLYFVYSFPIDKNKAVLRRLSADIHETFPITMYSSLYIHPQQKTCYVDFLKVCPKMYRAKQKYAPLFVTVTICVVCPKSENIKQ